MLYVLQIGPFWAADDPESTPKTLQIFIFFENQRDKAK